ncbi:chromate efflux transporter [Effusibacillus lacus]|uniref:Chromate transporter n=1 Tax=Effusibacillus lacus TaxID=1348429 RepID=A0A292YRI2_9BACL|nr:chromate efflux transporter [Effusibacillus lacus]TCS70067.1 chromate transporter [Effusibacillus lacus]GAX91095.1 chromate transporter [Effusibacillus lacus]
MNTERQSRLAEVAKVFLKLGTIGFGGPAAHVAMMEEEIVRRRKWLEKDKFLDLLGAANLIPGPNSTELAIHLGYQRAGWPGLFVAGACFILPAMLIVLAFAVIYRMFGELPEVSWVLYGIKPVIIAIVLQALWSLGKSALKNKQTVAAAALATVLLLENWNEILLLVLAGLFVMIINNRSRLGSNTAGLMLPLAPVKASPFGFPAGWLLADGVQQAVAGSMSLAKLFLVFLKIGSVLYGSGYVLLAFLQSDFVERNKALTSQQLIDAVAIGQFTPGPLFTTATFIGYLIQGTPGAILATIGIFLPAFVFVALTSPWIPKLRRSPWLSAFLDGVNAASLALMAVVAWQLGQAAVVDWTTALLALASLFLVIRFKVNSALLVIGGGIIGFVTQVWFA